MTCWGRTTHVGGTRDARLQGYQVSSVLCPRGVTVMDAQKRLISNPAGQYDVLLCARSVMSLGDSPGPLDAAVMTSPGGETRRQGRGLNPGNGLAHVFQHTVRH